MAAKALLENYLSKKEQKGMISLQEIQDLLYQEYIKNDYEAMWNDKKNKGNFIASLFAISGKVQQLAAEMEHIRDGHAYNELDVTKISKEDFLKMSMIAELCLVVTEISEAITAVLIDDMDNANEEGADIMIRTLNCFNRNTKCNMEQKILYKHVKNLKRQKLHGRVV